MPTSSQGAFLEFLPLRYQVEEVLSQGDRAATVRVLDTGLRQSAAVVKIQRLSDPGGNDDVEDDFLRFCSALCSLKHPNIGTPYTYGTFRDGAAVLYGYTTRPFIHGLSLAELPRPLDERSVIRAGVQICQGLEVLHDTKLRHHDLKLENVIVRRAGDGDIDQLSQCVLIDLSYRPRTDRDQTALSEVTLQYVAPELLAGDDGDVQSDLYSLGVLLYAALTGELPFPGDSVAEIIRNQRGRNFVPIHEKRNDVCPQLRRVVERLLEPHPQNRSATAAATIASIEECDDRGAAPPLMIRRPRWGSVFSGREVELLNCLSSLSPQRSGDSDPCIEVRGAPQSGVTSFLRELQDRLEAGGVTILTASPQAVCGTSLQAQLFVPVHRLVRRASEAGKGATAALQERRVAESSTDLLDDLFVATRGRRVVLFVDDWHACNLSEVTFLDRLVRQDLTKLGEEAIEGRCQVVLGATGAWRGQAPALERFRGRVTKRVQLGSWTRDDLRAFLRLAEPSLSLTASVCERVVDAAGGRPGIALAILESLCRRLGHNEDVAEGLDLSIAEVQETHGQEGRLASEVAEIEGHVLGPSVLALALWGDDLPWTTWCDLVGILNPGASTDPPREFAEVVYTGARRQVRSRRPYLGNYLLNRLDDGARAALVASVLDSVSSLWRSRRADELLALLRFVGRVGFVPPSARWGVCRALMVLLRSGRLAEVANTARLLSTNCGAKSEIAWATLFAEAADVALGVDAKELDSAERSSRSPISATTLYRSWIEARRLWRGRYRVEAYEILRGLVDQQDLSVRRSGIALAEDCALLAAELGRLDEAKRLRRSMLKGLVARGAQPRLGAGDSQGPLNRMPTKRAKRLARDCARYWRVRHRIHWSARRYRAAASCARKERAYHGQLGSLFGEAACLNNEGVALLRASAPDKGRGALEACACLRERLDDERGLVVALNNLALAYAGLGEPSNAAAVLNRARVVAARNGLVRHLNLSTLHLGLSYVRSGQLRDARRVFWRLISLARECKDYEVQAKAMLNYAGIALDCWHLAIAESYLDKTSGLLASASRPAGDELVLRARADLAARTLDVSRLKTAIAESGDLTADDSSEILDYHCLLAAVQGAEWPEKELWEHQGKASTGDVTRLLHKTRALKKRLTAHSLGRALRLSQHELSTRKGFEWIVAHYANGVTNPEVSIALGWQFLAKPEYREGHDDLQIELRARMARLLLASGRQREAWGLLEDALFRFRKLESKVERWGRPQGVLDRLHRLLCAAMGIENRASLGSAHRRSSVLQAEAFRAVMTRGVSALAAPRNSSHEMLMRLAKTVGAVTEPDDLVDALLDLALASSGAQRAVLVTVEHGERYVRGHKLASGTSERADEGDLSWAIVSKVLSSGEAEVYGDALAAEQLASHRSVALLNLRSLACVPLIAPDGVMGVLYLDHQGVAGLFGEELLGFLSLLANVMATSLSALEISREVEASKSKLAEAHQQLVRSERNRLAGQIASGIAHDIKNVLATIVARCQLTRQAQDAVEVAKPLRAIEEAAHSAATMLEKLQECSREHLLQKEEPTDLSTVAAEAVELLTPRFASSKGSGADAIRVDVDAQSGVITDCVPGEVRELFLNLMVNACDAMADGGTLSISVKGDPREGEAIIKVSDTGTGMSEEVRERIFEPFFTTKGRQGTGLGLAVVKNVVLRYAGSISVESCEGVGTTITVNFPMAARRVGSGIGGRAGRSRVPSRSLRERPGS